MNGHRQLVRTKSAMYGVSDRVLQSMSASAGVNSSPWASATGLQVISPSQTLRPLRKWMSSFKAWRQPLSASCNVKGKVALLSAKVDVR
jgi:hypothetical protein